MFRSRSAQTLSVGLVFETPALTEWMKHSCNMSGHIKIATSADILKNIIISFEMLCFWMSVSKQVQIKMREKIVFCWFHDFCTKKRSPELSLWKFEDSKILHSCVAGMIIKTLFYGPRIVNFFWNIDLHKRLVQIFHFFQNDLNNKKNRKNWSNLTVSSFPRTMI